jgi:hypothetical protein
VLLGKEPSLLRTRKIPSRRLELSQLTAASFQVKKFFTGRFAARPSNALISCDKSLRTIAQGGTNMSPIAWKSFVTRIMAVGIDETSLASNNVPA